MREQPILVLRYTIADLQTGVDLRCAALEGINRVEIGNRDRVLNPAKELLVQNNPNYMEIVKMKFKGFHRVEKFAHCLAASVPSPKMC